MSDGDRNHIAVEMISIADNYYNGGEWQDPTVISYLNKAASRNNPKANYIKAQLESTPSSKISYLNKAVNGGYSDANLLLSKSHLELQDTAKAIESLLKIRNNAEAALILGQIYFKSGKYSLARDFFEQVSDHNIFGAKAKSYIGDYYYYGIGCNKDVKKAMEVYSNLSPEDLSVNSRMNIGAYYVMEYNDKLTADRYLYQLPLAKVNIGDTPLADIMRSMGKFFYDKNNEHHSQSKTFSYLASRQVYRNPSYTRKKR